MENLLQGPGLLLLLCVGAIILVVVVGFVARSVLSARNRQTGYDSRQTGYGTSRQPLPREDDQTYNDQPGGSGVQGRPIPRGSEQPRYDNDEVRSSGGFGRPGGRPTPRRNRRKGGGGFGSGD